MNRTSKSALLLLAAAAFALPACTKEVVREVPVHHYHTRTVVVNRPAPKPRPAPAPAAGQREREFEVVNQYDNQAR